MENKTLGEKTADAIIHMIRERGYEQGEKLPTESELTQILGVGRNTVREALRLLVSRNIVVIRQGAGTFVSDKRGIADDPLGFSMVEDEDRLVNDLIQMRQILEPSIAELAAQNREEQEVSELMRILEETERLIEQRADFSLLDMQFHEQIARMSHNGVISNLLPVIENGIRIFAAKVEEPEYQQTMRSHRIIYEAIRDQKPVEAKNAMTFHLMFNENRFRVGF